MLIRPPGPDDLPAVAAIYNREVDEGMATFDTEHRPVSHWQTLLTDEEPFLAPCARSGTSTTAGST